MLTVGWVPLPLTCWYVAPLVYSWTNRRWTNNRLTHIIDCLMFYLWRCTTADVNVKVYSKKMSTNTRKCQPFCCTLVSTATANLPFDQTVLWANTGTNWLVSGVCNQTSKSLQTPETVQSMNRQNVTCIHSKHNVSLDTTSIRRVVSETQIQLLVNNITWNPYFRHASFCSRANPMLKRHCQTTTLLERRILKFSIATKVHLLVVRNNC